MKDVSLFNPIGRVNLWWMYFTKCKRGCSQEITPLIIENPWTNNNKCIQGISSSNKVHTINEIGKSGSLDKNKERSLPPKHKDNEKDLHNLLGRDLDIRKMYYILTWVHASKTLVYVKCSSREVGRRRKRIHTFSHI